MIAAIKSELIRLKRPSFIYGGVGLMGMFAALMTIFAFSTAGGDTTAPGPGGLPDLSALEAAGGFLASLGTISTIVGLITLAFWAIAAATDYSSGLVRVITQAQPNRITLLLGKTGALALWTAVGTFAATLVAAASSFGLAAMFDVNTEAWSQGWLTTLASGWTNLYLAAMVWGIIGLVIATVTRSSGLAIAGGIGYLMVVENMIGLVAEGATDWMPGGVLTALAGGGTATIGYLTALALAATYAASAMTLAALTVRTRDIVS
jgi:ABC-2 type transport system permease protein